MIKFVLSYMRGSTREFLRSYDSMEELTQAAKLVHVMGYEPEYAKIDLSNAIWKPIKTDINS